MDDAERLRALRAITDRCACGFSIRKSRKKHGGACLGCGARLPREITDSQLLADDAQLRRELAEIDAKHAAIVLEAKLVGPGDSLMEKP